MKAPPPTERQTQRAILTMMGLSFPDVFVIHVPNGAHLFGSKADRCRQMGVLLGDGLCPGFPDLPCWWNGGAALLEVKRPGYSPSDVTPDQRKVHKRLAELGWPVAIVTSIDEAYAHLIECGAPCARVWRAAA